MIDKLTLEEQCDMYSVRRTLGGFKWINAFKVQGWATL